jgi:hypothetical protein
MTAERPIEYVLNLRIMESNSGWTKGPENKI